MTSAARLVHRRHGVSDPGGVSGRASGLGFGGDYNPEQWDEVVWAEDARLMGEAGITFVTVGVFAWARIQPSQGAWDLGWLDRVLDLMDAHDVAVDLATATASPPAWLVRQHPEVLPIDRDGRRLDFGGRQAWCSASPVYREHSLALVDVLARRYAGHPALIMWHVSNELGCHNAYCYCPASATAFRAWLTARYGDLTTLNEAWGTTFWSQAYGDWSEIEPPRAVTAIPNPMQELDFKRFSSDALLDQHRAERALLAELSPGVPVTTNFMVTHHVDGLDYWRWAPEQDVVSNDHYLDGRLTDPHVELSFSADWTRGLAGGAPWVLMEHSTSAVNWQPINYAKRPGQLARNTLQHVARGADSAGFFQWRASRSGAERHHSALLPHAGTQTRLWREVTELGAVLGRLGEVAGTRVRADVAMLLDWDSLWAVQSPSLPRDDLSYLDRAHALYRALWDRGVTVDVRRPGDDLSGYRLVLVPTLHVISDADAAGLTAYVEGGGHLLVTYFSGVADPSLRVRLGGYPGAFRDLLGVTVEEFLPLRPDETLELVGEGAAGSADTWAEDLRLTSAEAVWLCEGGPADGGAALTRRAAGQGLAWYLSTRTDGPATAALVDRLLSEAGVTSGGVPGVEIVRRVGDGASYLFVLNHRAESAIVTAYGVDLVSQQEVAGELHLTAGGVACVREARPAEVGT